MSHRPTLEELQSALRASWCAETAHTPHTWSSANPSAGQCWTTAYVVRHFLGGEILYAELMPQSEPVERHAWNRLPDGNEVDLTREQLPKHQALRQCDIPEAIVAAVSGAQAQRLLERVSRLLDRSAVVNNDG